MARLSIFFLVFFASIRCMMAQSIPANDSLIQLSEPYELANIILSLTQYGKTDPWEVSQKSAYYQEVRTYFDQFSDHPLLAKVNYSRKQWESYLSFRTDSYAFTFDKANKLVRRFPFQTIQGFNPFEENMEMVENFVNVTGFRRFYQQHHSYYQNLARDYLKSQRYPEMLSFLEKEFGKRQGIVSYAIAVSPLVGRMNCHRVVSGVGTDFITLPEFLLTDRTFDTENEEEIASGSHMLFTELDHAFVNPLTDLHSAIVKNNFANSKWDSGSGYEKDSLATFNEYMTWAVYNLYVRHYFPTVATKVGNDWALQNETRGFYASSLFNEKLDILYRQRKAGQTLKDIYPAFIEQLGSLQTSLSKPLIKACNLDNQIITDSTAEYVIHFSQQMIQTPSLDLIHAIDKHEKVSQERIILTSQANGLFWSENGRVLHFKLKLAKGATNYLTFNSPWKTLSTLTSIKGINLTPYSQIKTTVK